MGIDERRAREKDRRRREILDAAWAVAREVGWSAFSVERVGAKAELGRATVYGYFESLDALVEAMADEALTRLSDRVSSTQGLEGALDAPVRFSQADPAAFALLFQATLDPRPAFASEALARVRAEAQQLIRIARLAVSGRRLAGRRSERRGVLDGRRDGGGHRARAPVEHAPPPQVARLLLVAARAARRGQTRRREGGAGALQAAEA